MKALFGLIAIVILSASCKTNEDNLPIREKRQFTSFEFSYTDAGTKSFSVRVDSNNIFFFPKTWDTVKYGLLPDTLAALVNLSVAEIIGKELNKKPDNVCEGCRALAIELITNSDTIRVVKTGDQIGRVFYRMVKSYEQFFKNDQLSLTNPNIAMVLETQRMIKPPPSEVIH
jgi:hypothetical protein